MTVFAHIGLLILADTAAVAVLITLAYLLGRTHS